MENGKEQLRMEIESLSKNEGLTRAVVAVLISRTNPTLEGLGDVKTTVSEVVTNTVIHGYQGKDGIIYVEVNVEDDELTVIVRGKGVDIQDVKQTMEPMLTSDTTGKRSGMGFSFMEAFMDEAGVESVPDEGTTVTTRK